MDRYRISFAGAGKVASSLSTELKAKGHNILKIVSPSREKGTLLAARCDSLWSDITDFNLKEEIIIVAVPDKLLAFVLEGIKCEPDTVVVHTAGSYGLEVFPPSIKRCGVFYPLQTFSEGREVKFPEIPVFTEADGTDTEYILKNLAESLGCRTFASDTEHRRLLHVAAVFVSNFTNFMLTSGEMVAGKAGFAPELLRPLIGETVKKACDIGPLTSQTGPAVRYDYNTIEKHLELLSFSPELQRVYEELSLSIMNFYKKEGRNEQL